MNYNIDMKRDEFYKRKYISFLFSDYKAIPYWIFIFVFCIVFTMISYLKTSKFEVFGAFFLYFVIYIGFYTISYFRYNAFFKLKEVLENKGFDVENGQCRIDFMPKDLIMTSPQQNYNARIKLNSYNETCSYLQTTDLLALFYPIRELGVFQYYQLPIIVNHTGVLPSYLHSFKLKIVDCQNVTENGDETVINLGKNHCIYLYDDIKKNIECLRNE